MVNTKSLREIELMKDSAKILIEVFAELKNLIKPGVTTLYLDEVASRIITENRAKAAFLGYNGYPATVCASVNEELIHGIPKKRILKNGDIVSIDVGAVYKGYYSDAARTYSVGEISDAATKLIEVTRESFYEGMKFAKPGSHLGDICSTIGEYVNSFDFNVPLEYTGHGIGSSLHEEPAIPNYGIKGTGVVLKPGMVLAIEPMVMMGSAQTMVLADSWTVVTKDKSWCAHYENTVLITEEGYEILTKKEG